MSTAPNLPTAPIPMLVSIQPAQDPHDAAWHSDRLLGIGGSESAALFNEGYGCHRNLVMVKRGVPADYKYTAEQEKLFKRGNKMENMVAAEFSEETGLKVRRQPSRASKTHPRARVNMDRQIVAVDAQQLYRLTARDGFSPLADILDNPGPGALECKTMNQFDFRVLQKEGFTKHPHYILQLQHALAVTGYRWGAYAVMEPASFELVWFVMVRNEELIAAILERTDSTWALVEDTAAELPERLPDGDKRCAKCLHRRTCRGDQYLAKFAGAAFDTDYINDESPDITELANDLLVATEAEDQASAVTKAIKEKIKAYMEETGTTKLCVPDVIRFCRSFTDGRKTWDGKAIEGEINALNKGELPPLGDVALAKLAEHADIVAPLLAAMAKRLKDCQKIGAPSSSFRTYNV